MKRRSLQRAVAITALTVIVGCAQKSSQITTELVTSGTPFAPFNEIVSSKEFVFRLPEILPDPNFVTSAKSDYQDHPFPPEIPGEDKWRTLQLLRVVRDASANADHYIFEIEKVNGRMVLYSRDSASRAFRGRCLVPHY